MILTILAVPGAVGGLCVEIRGKRALLKKCESGRGVVWHGKRMFLAETDLGWQSKPKTIEKVEMRNEKMYIFH